MITNFNWSFENANEKNSWNEISNGRHFLVTDFISRFFFSWISKVCFAQPSNFGHLDDFYLTDFISQFFFIIFKRPIKICYHGVDI